MPFSAAPSEDLLQLNSAEFDFNVQFEQLFFSIIPSTLFIVTSLWRTLSLARKPTVVDAPFFQLVKLGTIATYVGLELALLILVAIGSFQVTSMFIASSVLKLLAALLMVVVSLIDHSKSPRPSVLLGCYLVLTLLLDATQARTLFLSSSDRPELTYSSVFTAAVGLKVAILLLEAQKKSPYVRWNEKEHSPEETSSIFSLGVFYWLNNLFMDGYKKILTLEDLYPLDSALEVKVLQEKLSKELDYSKLKDDKHALTKALIRTLRVPLLLPVPMRLALLGFTFCQPFFIEKLLDHLSKPKVDADVGYGFIGASFLIYLGLTISIGLYWYYHNRMRTMIASILVAETYKKATQARIGTENDSAVLTLMSTDIERIKEGIVAIHEVWATLIQIALASYMLYSRLGVAFVASIAVILGSFIGLAIPVKFTGSSQIAWMNGIQKRVGLTATVIANMKSLKMSGLAAPVADYVSKLRAEELRSGSRFRFIIMVAAFFAYCPMLVSPPLTFAFTRKILDSSRIFTSLSYLLLLTNPLSQILQAVPQIIGALACLGRIQKFLECETREDYRKILADAARNPEDRAETVSERDTPQPESTYSIAIEDGNFGWEADKLALQNVNTRILSSSLTMVVGPVGSGKSTLCKALIGEIPVSKGKVDLRTRVAHVGYCDQEIFLSNGSIRDNIVGYSEFDEQRYAEVIECTALSFDLDLFPRGDATNVGSDGITLSGGQKQRVALARALYLQTDLIILDDVLSGLDADTEEHVFTQVFGSNGLLKRRRSTVVLCTHSVRHLPTSDFIISLRDGSIAEQGTFDELMASDGYVQRIGLKGSSDNDASSEETASTSSGQDSKPRFTAKAHKAAASISPEQTDESRQVGDKTVYMHYLKSMGVSTAVASCVSVILWGFFVNFPTIWLKYWSDAMSSKSPHHPFGYYAAVYGALQGCAILSLLCFGIIMFLIVITRTGSRLHQDTLHTMVRAPLHFFTSTDTGVITNLFSQDLNLVDTELPLGLVNTMVCSVQAVGQAAVMISTSAYIAISYPFLGLVLYIVQKFYLRTSRQLRLLELEAKSPLYTHFIDTVKGLTTIRAFGFVSEDIKKNIRLINVNQRPTYLLLMIQQWLIVVLNLVVMLMAVTLTVLSVRLHSNSGFAGASMVSLINFGDNLSGIVIFWTRLETSMGAVSRLKSFKDKVKPEETEEEDLVPPEEWPSRGVIELNGVSASYDVKEENDNTPTLALDNIQLTISAGQKLAITGRTGSGKSSLISLLLKLLEPCSGSEDKTVIDGTPLWRINRPALRQRLLAMPQEAVFLPDRTSFQANLDPLGLSNPEERQTVLEAVGLWQFVLERGGLDAGMSASTLSAGQRQLVSLGRLLLRRRIRSRHIGSAANSGVLLLDEVSSNVDHETERVMQNVISTEFKDYTVLAVSHRLGMIMDFDRVVVMDAGAIIESGNPAILAKEPGSRFGELVRAGAK